MSLNVNSNTVPSSSGKPVCVGTPESQHSIDLAQFEKRKRDHIQHSLDPANQARGMSGLASVHLFHEALPELDFAEVSLQALCLGKTARTPFYIPGMTAGHQNAPTLNRVLAVACASRGWAMGVGSQRRELETGESGMLDQWKQIRAEAPGLALFANIGLSQVILTSTDAVRRVVESLDATALAVHCNALQEAIQPEGTPSFKGGMQALERLVKTLGRPVVLKETGCGFSAATLRKLSSIGLAAIDVSGLGGTHWGRIEGARAPAGSLQATASMTFSDWGESTVDSVIAASQALRSTGTEIWASGGLRTGLDAAKLIALGADRVGFAQPALQAALEGADALDSWMKAREFELKVALFCTGSADPGCLQKKENAWKRTPTFTA